MVGLRRKGVGVLGARPVAEGYRAEVAQKRADTCTISPRVAPRLRPAGPLWGRVMRYLKKGYSPEQIAGTLALVHPDTPCLRVSHETIYTACLRHAAR